MEPTAPSASTAQWKPYSPNRSASDTRRTATIISATVRAFRLVQIAYNRFRVISSVQEEPACLESPELK